MAKTPALRRGSRKPKLRVQPRGKAIDSQIDREIDAAEQLIARAYRMLIGVSAGNYPGQEIFRSGMAWTFIYDGEDTLAQYGKQPSAAIRALRRQLQSCSAAVAPAASGAALGDGGGKLTKSGGSAPNGESTAPPITPSPEHMYTEKEAAQILRVSPKTLEARRFSGMGGPPFIRPAGTRAIRYLGADLQAFIAGARQTSTSS